jgi:hypothetical protein
MAEGRLSTRRKRKGMRHDRSLALAVRPAGSLKRATWFAMMMAILLAFTWQSFVTQTHRHYDALSAAAATTGVAVQQAGKSSPADLPASCPICSELAHAGQVILPAPVTLAAPIESPVWLASTTPLALSRAERSHAWRSRAPPASLQA